MADYPKEFLEALERDAGVTFKGGYDVGEDGRLCYGAMCTWFGNIAETKPSSDGLPVCPHCGGILFEMSSKEEWWNMVDVFERERPYPGYRAMWEWQQAQKKCFSTREGIKELAEAYDKRST